MKIAYLKPVVVLLALCGMAAFTASAQTYKALASFDGTNGYGPSTLVQGLDGNFYGTTWEGGSFRNGTAFQMTPEGTLTTLYIFCNTKHSSDCPSGRSVSSGLLLAKDGTFFGTTAAGGANGANAGTIFRMNSAGHLNVIHDFCSLASCADGEWPSGGLVQTLSGDFYGTTSGGAELSFATIFEVTSTGSLTNLYSGCQLGCGTEGASPSGPLIEGTDGNLYGASYFAGTNGGGTIFRITPTGNFAILYSFCSQTNCTDGKYPMAGLVQGTDRAFYGVTTSGGKGGYGAVFRLGPTGVFTTVHSFCPSGNLQDCPDGSRPNAALILASDGNLYGTTSEGGANGMGTLFKIGAKEAFTSVYSFTGEDGAQFPEGIVQGTDGNFYGTSNNGFGVIYSLSLGLRPFVRALPTGGTVGATVKILGQGLTGTTSVLFNGTSATFQATSDTYLTATIPAGATNGYISVITSSGTLTSNIPFNVR
jgi:uncharacterized repeat protein (TIGR03803 family)